MTPMTPMPPMTQETSRRRLTLNRLLMGAVVAVGMFVALGTLSALWENAYFIRMVPAGNWEVGLLALLSVLSGAYVAVRRPFCSNKKVGTGGLLGFLGVACPVCNKILMMIFGGEFLLTYFEPTRLYLAAFGVALTAWALVHEWRQWDGGVGEKNPQETERAASDA